ncbi:DUF6171 family protein [Lapidilactobacillus achengensis]|uniref:DUF6171 family protein n=1 Tax=Lapidilactobacillus achengensis TaxID=2486000 RepID=A0ABW1UQ57_9LACO
MSRRNGNCVRCDLLDELASQDVAANIAEQLSLEVGNLVDPEIRDQRLVICQSCPFFQNGTCLKCGCYTQFRASLKNKTCPEGRW